MVVLHAYKKMLTGLWVFKKTLSAGMCDRTDSLHGGPDTVWSYEGET